MAAIRKRGQRWQAQVRRKGQPPTTRSFRLKADALTWARQAEAKADRRELPADPKVLERTTLGDVLVRYRDTVVTVKGSREIETIILNAILRTDLAKLQLADLSPAPQN